MDNKIGILIVDDQQLFAEGLKYVIEARAKDMEVVGIASGGIEACDKVEELKPDIVLMDVQMPEMDGVVATASIMARVPSARIVMLTTFGDDDYVKRAMQNGAVGYLLKNHPPIHLIHSIRAVNDGVAQIDPQVMESVFHRDMQIASQEDRDVEALIDSLTAREKDVLRLLSQALENRQIADHLHVTEQTVRNYVSVIYSKLRVSSRLEIVRLLKRIGY